MRAKVMQQGVSAAPEAPGASPAARPRRHIRGAALWTTVGFVAGAVFWHAVGFWTFMSQLVFDGENVPAQSVAAPAPLDGSEIETGSLPTILRIDPARCISLELDRLSNRTAARPCPPNGLALRLESGGERGDLALLADNVPR